ncbi:phosphatidylinositol glycan, class O [Strigomonas culicis]|uniref:Phosphatidylinositol glycan, class O n=1 Tax=Strigomonas culicis TaxID=28005 RepID=S9UP98_9TRYP|nr:phosphatidylinositol glycan, class O [Strigomonas culicis]|eukprot:EPY32702.1 phosphatidylinositol glycan, class O [Strigomonas culicis]
MRVLPCLTFILIGVFVFSSVFFTTSMLSATVVVSSNGTAPCGGMRPVDQVVVIVIDALRPDFVLSNLRAYNREDGACTVPQTSEENRRRYMGSTLRYIERCLSEPDDASYGYFLVADAPTTTAQRIKAIATGTMPAFLEAGSNFNSDATPLDSIVRQAGGRAVLLGDDTWTRLFPDATEAATGRKRHWKSTTALPSFDVADFHTNDDAVLRTVFGVLDSETREKDDAYAELIIAHFLGVDHVGHRFNAENSEMAAKLRQLNVMLHNVTVSLRERRTAMSTMLLVLGDHGMTSSGDHGGGSPLETDTFLFAQYFAGDSNTGKERRHAADLEQVSRMSEEKKKLVHELNADRWRAGADEELLRLASCQRRAEVCSEKLGAAYQVDVTPTITALLGKPIPFSSFGRVLPEVLALADEHVDLEAVEQCNWAQMQRYFEETGTKLPAPLPWGEATGLPLRSRVARMSFFARRARTDMHRSGMFVGSTLLLVCALSVFFVPGIRDVFVRRTQVLVWTGAVFVARLIFVFSNSFVVNEDVEVFTLLGTLLVLSAMRTSRRGRCLYLVGLLACMRAALPYALRHREHISHNVESSSRLDDLAVAWLPLKTCERAGVVVLWSAALAAYGLRRDRRATAWAVAACAVMCACYKVVVLHHAAPLALGIGYAASGAGRKSGSALALRPALFSYLLGVAWVASLCNEKCVVAIIIAVYGVTLPLLARAVHHMPVETQAVVLHLSAYTAFFFQGHQCMLNTIDWNASFVGVPFYNIVLGAVLVLSRTFNAFLLVPVAYQVSTTVLARKDGSLTLPPSALPRHLLVHLCVVQGAVSCFNGYIQKDHLMMFPIFCPKLIFDVVIAFVTAAGFLLSMAIS